MSRQSHSSRGSGNSASKARDAGRRRVGHNSAAAAQGQGADRLMTVNSQAPHTQPSHPQLAQHEYLHRQPLRQPEVSNSMRMEAPGVQPRSPEYPTNGHVQSSQHYELACAPGSNCLLGDPPPYTNSIPGQFQATSSVMTQIYSMEDIVCMRSGSATVVSPGAPAFQPSIPMNPCYQELATVGSQQSRSVDERSMTTNQYGHHMQDRPASHLQEQAQVPASLHVETSRQMVYNSFTWTIGSIEALEHVEMRSKGLKDLPAMSESSKPMYKRMKKNRNGSKITMEEMILQCNNFLLIMNDQLHSCNETIKQTIHDELHEVGQAWAVTGSQDAEHQSFYFKRELLRVIRGRQAVLLPVPNPTVLTTNPDATTMGRVTQLHQRGLKAGDDMDESFRRDQTKHAELPEFRGEHC